MRRLLCLALAFRARAQLYVTITPVPGYTGPLSVHGSLTITDLPAATLSVSYSLTGLRAATSGGAHVHAGTSCSDPLGHYWSNDGGVTQGTNTSFDLWAYPANASAPPKFAVSSAAGASSGAYTIISGYTTAQVVNHAFIIHDGDVNKTKLGCGIAAYPGPIPPPPSPPPPPFPPALVRDYKMLQLGLACAVGILGCAACVMGLYVSLVRRHAYLLKQTYPLIGPEGPDVTPAWEPEPRVRPTGAWSAFSESAFPAVEREPNQEEHERIKSFFRQKYNSLDGWETSTATYRSY